MATDDRPAAADASRPREIRDGRFVCSAENPMPLKAPGHWLHPDAKFDFDEYGSLGSGGSHEHYTCPHCKKGFYVELPD